MKRFAKWFLTALFFCLVPCVSGVQANDAPSVVVSDISFLQRGTDTCYQTGENTLSIELYMPNGGEQDVLLIFSVMDAPAQCLQAAATGYVKTTSIITPYTLCVQIPETVDVLQTQAKLLILHADTLQPLVPAYTILPQQTYPYIAVPQKTHMLKSYSGTVLPNAPQGSICLQTASQSITLPATAEVLENLSLYENRVCDVFLDIDAAGNYTVSAVSVQTLTIWCYDFITIADGEIAYYDTEDGNRRKSLPLDSDVTGTCLGIDIPDVSQLSWMSGNQTYGIFFAIADTDDNGKIDLINVYRTDHAAIVAVDGNLVHTLNMGTLDLSHTALTDKDGAPYALAQIRPGDVLAIAWHPTILHTPALAAVLPQSYEQGTIVEYGNHFLNVLIRVNNTNYRSVMPNASFPYPFPITVGMDGRFYLDSNGEIFAAKKLDIYDYPNNCDWLEAALSNGDPVTDEVRPVTIHTSCHGQYTILKDTPFMIYDNTGLANTVTLETIVQKSQFTGTSMEGLFGRQQAMTLYQLLCQMNYLATDCSTDQIAARIVCVSDTYINGKRSFVLAPVLHVQQALLSDAVFQADGHAFYANGTAYPIASDAKLLSTHDDNGWLSVEPIQNLNEGSHDVLLFGKNLDDKYAAVLILQTPAPSGWRDTYPAIVLQSKNTGNALQLLVAVGDTQTTVQMNANSVNADSNASFSLTQDSIHAGTVLLYHATESTITDYRIVGTCSPSADVPFVLEPSFAENQHGIGLTKFELGYLTDVDIADDTIYKHALFHSGTTARPIYFDDAFQLRGIQINALQDPSFYQANLPLDALLPIDENTYTYALVYTRDEQTQEVVLFQPPTKVLPAWETVPMAIITRVIYQRTPDGNHICNLSVGIDGKTPEVTYTLNEYSINADTGTRSALEEQFDMGDIILCRTDASGTCYDYRIVGRYEKKADVPFVLGPSFAADDNGLPGDRYRVGYLAQALPGAQYVFSFPDTGEQETFRVDTSVHEYCVNDINPLNPRIEIGSFNSGNVDEPFEGECSYVLLHTRNGKLIDIVGFNTRSPYPG